MYHYVVLGAGIQGSASAYDLAKFGEASSVRLLDLNLSQAQEVAQRLNQMLGTNLIIPGSIDVSNRDAVMQALQEADACLSAVPYQFNVQLAECAVATKTHFCDLGGNTEVVLKELALNEKALAAGVSLIPDCGLMPGMGNTIAVYGMEQLDKCDEVQIRCGGLPQTPRPPMGYKLVFSIGGLTNEYFGKSVILRDGKVTEIDTFSELETLEIPAPVGLCEAFTTSGGTSTCPWTFEGELKTYEYKTIRYPGHFDQFKLLLDLGLLDLEPVAVKNQAVVPRDLFHAVVQDKLSFPEDKDLVVLRITCHGTKDGHPKTLQYTIIDFHDDATGFSAMARTTGYPAAIVTHMMARGESVKGGVPLEKSIPAAPFMAELAKRGIVVDTQELNG